MTVSLADLGMLVLTPDLLQLAGRNETSAGKLDDAKFGRLKVCFQPIEDLASALDRIALREIAA